MHPLRTPGSRLLSCLNGAWLTLLVLMSANTPADVAGDWPQHGRTSKEERYSPLRDINTHNVANLGLAWYLDLDTRRGQEATPLVVDGVMYTTTAWSKVVAVDAASGEKLWQFDPQVPGEVAVHACCDVVNRGAAFADGRVFFASLDGRLFALDAKSGREIWSAMTVDPEKPYTITGAPRVARGKVFIGNGGADMGVRGYVSAYAVDTGEQVWRFYTVPGQPGVKDGAASDAVLEKLARDTWHGDKYWTYGGGGTVWDAIVYDEELEQLYLGVGNGSPWNHQIRSAGKGDNLFLSSIVALDPDTGEYLWHYQETPGESWDFTASQQMILTEMEVRGRTAKVILHAPKNGFFYIVDRENGRLLAADKFAQTNWAEGYDLDSGRPIENPEARYVDKPFIATTGAPGAHNWHAMALNPELGLVYIPVQQIPFFYSHDKKFRLRPGLWNVGIDLMSSTPRTGEEIDAMEASIYGALLAWDPRSQQPAWSVRRDSAPNGGVLATAGNLVFQGVADGTLRAHDARSGEELWRFATGAPILAAPVSYSVRGEQYVAVMVGNGGGLGLSLPSFDGPRLPPPGRILAFKLSGGALLPSGDSQKMLPVQRAEKAWTDDEIAKGKAIYDPLCSVCHGMGTLSSGILPDLKRSPALTNKALWRAIVYQGAYAARGMVGFANHLSGDEVEAVRGYVAREAALAAGDGPGKAELRDE